MRGRLGTGSGVCWRVALALLALAIWGPPLTGGAQEVNAVRAIRLGPTAVEIELESSIEFRVGGQVTVLRIGSHEFMTNLPPADGSLNRLVFFLRPEDFARLRHGDPMSVHYGRSDPGPGRSFGRLDKSQAR
jgi:hypothetical protein